MWKSNKRPIEIDAKDTLNSIYCCVVHGYDDKMTCGGLWVMWSSERVDQQDIVYLGGLSKSIRDNILG